MNKQKKIRINMGTFRKKPGIVSQAFFQILTLIISTFAFAFLIAAASVAATPTVEAAQPACCEKLQGSSLFCQNAMSDSCDPAFKSAPTSCDSTSFCKLGCCYDSVEGTCAENTPRKLCDLRNGTFDTNADCKIAQCAKGCCVLGNEASLTSLVRCKKLASFYGLETDFRSSITSEAACVAIAQSQDKGACVIDMPTGERNCKFTSRAECKTLTRNETAFYKDFLCSAEQLATTCARQHHTGCVDGKDEVYWFDSCGNAENIYNSDKTRSFNNGKVLTKEQSCGSGSSNTKSTSCGNCNYYQGSMCGKQRSGIEPRPATGDYICRDLNCYDTSNGKDYKHGESWCIYDGTVGQGTDLVGSRHWRHLCVMGEEKIEPCDDYRQGICVQGVLDAAEGKFTEATCRANRWRECLDYNTKPNMESLCNDNSDCYLLPISSLKSKVCVPQVPAGLSAKSVGEGASAASICGAANGKCSVVYEKTLFKGWVCKENCECKEQSWVNQMNKWCTSVGDCGGKMNIAGKVTKDGYQISGSDKQPIIDTSSGEPGMFGQAMPWVMSLGGIFGGWALTGAIKASTLGLAAKGTETTLLAALTKTMADQWMWNVGANLAAIGMAYLLITTSFGLKGESAMIVGLTGLGAGVTVWGLGTQAWASSWFGATSFFGVWAPSVYGIIAMLIVAAVLKAMKVGETKVVEVTFTCLPWQAPSGGQDCEKCNKEPLGGEFKPCSKYRCESLGVGCSLLNEGLGNELCVWLNKDDTNAPVVKPFKDVLTKDHSYQDVKPCPPGPGCWKITRTGATDGCIKAFTPLTFGIETNEPAQCKVETNHTAKFDDMQFFFGDNLYLYNHTMQMSLPAPAAINAQAASPELKNDGKYTLYVRCRDGNGNWNLGEMAMQFCVEPGPDTTPPVVMRTSILNGAPVAYGSQTTPLDIYLNEPSECKWSRTDQAYENMNNTFACTKNIEQMEGDLTYKCSTTLTKIADKTTNTYYFRCKDQPWLAGTKESDRNTNKESYVFKLEGTIPLNISKIGPNGTIKYGSEPIPITLKVETVNGYSNGDARCSFSALNYENMIDFFTTDTNVHEQKLDLYAAENNTYYVLCRDAGGNTDRAATSFKTEVDKTAPLIIRVYQDAGMLKIVTDEDSECKYSIKDCKFDFTTATDMPFTLSTEHTADWRTDITYYIKCKDQYGNMPASSDCSMQVNAYDVQTASE